MIAEFRCKDITCPNCNSEIELEEIDIVFNLSNKILKKDKWYGVAKFKCYKCNSIVVLRGTCVIK